MTVEVTTLNLSPLELEILILENAARAAQKHESRTYSRVIAAAEVWGAATDSLDKLNKALIAKRDEFLRRTV